MRANDSCSSKFNVKSASFKVVVPHIDKNKVTGRCAFAPQFARSKTDGVDMLPLIAEKMRARVWEAVNAMITDDRSRLASRVPRQTRMASRVDVARSDALTN